ncbi:MAG: aldose 1-epimerase family protein [Clostridiales bacterium]|nr:aldose 1-epimerase family protein [Clostridiales bacterium]
MFYKIENEFLTAEINDKGAELHSLKDKKSGYEYIWYGKTEIWYGQAPILFPIIGRLLDDKYRYNGTEYDMAKHGFARKMTFKALSAEKNKAVFLLESDETTLKSYPFKFKLYAEFELCGRVLKASHKVVNMNDGEMYFSLGGHPGFNCEIGDCIVFDEKETLSTETIDADSIRLSEKTPVLNDESSIEITKDIFSNDALILSGIKSKALTLKNKNGHSVHFTFGDVPYLGIWAKPGAPYVCIEPWCGVNDDRRKRDDISEKDGIVRLNEGETFDLTYTAEVN